MINRNKDKNLTEKIRGRKRVRAKKRSFAAKMVSVMKGCCVREFSKTHFISALSPDERCFSRLVSHGRSRTNRLSGYGKSLVSFSNFRLRFTRGIARSPNP